MDFHRIKNVLPQLTPSTIEWKGAVLFLCNEDHVFLIKRAEAMPTHGGQIAFVGGHKKPDETDAWVVAQREFEEEIHAKIEVDNLLAIGEIYFPWGKRPCHQICLYYNVHLVN